MPDLAKTLKEEIARIAKREAKQLVGEQAKSIAELKRRVSALNKQVTEQERFRKANTKAIAKVLPDATPDDLTPETRKWFTAKGVRSIRKRLGLTQIQFAKLTGMSPQAVIKWEAGKGKLRLQSKAYDALTAVREMGKQEAAEKLGMNSGRSGKAEK